MMIKMQNLNNVCAKLMCVNMCGLIKMAPLVKTLGALVRKAGFEPARALRTLEPESSECVALETLI